MEVKLLMENGCLEELNQKIRTKKILRPKSRKFLIQSISSRHILQCTHNLKKCPNKESHGCNPIAGMT